MPDARVLAESSTRSSSEMFRGWVESSRRCVSTLRDAEGTRARSPRHSPEERLTIQTWRGPCGLVAATIGLFGIICTRSVPVPRRRYSDWGGSPRFRFGHEYG